MSIFNSNNLSKSDLLELTISQKKQIEELTYQVEQLKEELLIKDKQIKERLDLIKVTNTLITLAKIADKKLTNSGGKEHE